MFGESWTEKELSKISDIKKRPKEERKKAPLVGVTQKRLRSFDGICDELASKLIKGFKL